MFHSYICFLDKRKKEVPPCGHELCKLCFRSLYKENCPFCRQPFVRKKKELIITDPESYKDLDGKEWVSFSRYLKNGTEIIQTFRSGDVPKSWRDDSLTTIVKRRRKRYDA